MIDRVNIAFIIVSLEAGGTESYLLRFIKFLRNQETNLQITIVCKGGKTGSLFKQFQEQSVAVEVLKLGYINFKNIQKFKSILNNNYDVVCDLTGNFAGLSMGLSKLNGIRKRVVFYRASSDHFMPSFFNNVYNKLMNRLVRKFATDILSNSQTAFRFYHEPFYKKDKRFKVVKNGVYAEMFSKSQDKAALRKKYNLPIDAFLVGHVGRLNAAKNFETMFRVIKEIKAKTEVGKQINFVFCGRETDSILFKQQLLRYGISEWCFCLGEQAKVYEVLQCYDLFYFPSLTEGQPNALIEAMISGLPFVASNIEAIKESVPEQAYGQLVNPLDVTANVIKIINTLHEPDPLLLQDWAINEYEAEKRFEDFKRILLD